MSGAGSIKPRVAAAAVWLAVWLAIALEIVLVGEARLPLVLGMLLAGGSALSATVWKESKYLVLIGLAGSSLAWIFLFAALKAGFLWAALAMALGIAAARHCRWLAFTWAFCVCVGWLALTYQKNDFYEFHLAVGATALLLIAIRAFLKLPGWSIQTVNTFILILIAVPLYDYAVRPRQAAEKLFDPRQRPYSFAAAKKDPGAFAAWWAYFHREAMQLHRQIGAKEPDRRIRWKFKPRSQARFFDSIISINSLGFRGPEIDHDKGKAFRIVALGESTTFGYTLTADAETWPRVLERVISERLPLGQPVQVINAGVYGLNIEENVHRLKTQLLGLKPDMIISYHGYNYFPTLHAGIPPAQGAPPPLHESRPLKILADFEYRSQMAVYKRNRATIVPQPEDASHSTNLLNSNYANLYREMAKIARDNGIKLAIANFSMAVNQRSPDDVIEFYRGGFPETREIITANRMHTQIVQEIWRQYPDVIAVDTQPALDGRHENYIDLVHFTQEGRNLLAEAMFRAIAQHLPARPD